MLLAAAGGSGGGGNQLSHAVAIPHDGQQQGGWCSAARTSLKTGDSLKKRERVGFGQLGNTSGRLPIEEDRLE